MKRLPSIERALDAAVEVGHVHGWRFTEGHYKVEGSGVGVRPLTVELENSREADVYYALASARQGAARDRWALDDLQVQLDGTEWDSATMTRVAAAVRSTGRQVRAPEEEPTR